MECEMPEFYSVKEPVASQDRKCCECSAMILTGEKYVYCAGKWDGDFNSYSQHVLCAEACEWFRDHINSGECAGFGYLFEEARDYFNYLDPKNKRDENIAAWRKMLADIRRRSRKEKPAPAGRRAR